MKDGKTDSTALSIKLISLENIVEKSSPKIKKESKLPKVTIVTGQARNEDFDQR